MQELVLRDATHEDAGAIAKLSEQLGYPTTPEQSLKRLVALFDSGEHVVTVACLSTGEVVGWIQVSIVARVESDAFAEVTGLVVSDQQRGRGIGKALVDAGEEWVRSIGFKRLVVRSQSRRVGAHAFYLRQGFEFAKEQQVFTKMLN